MIKCFWFSIVTSIGYVYVIPGLKHPKLIIDGDEYSVYVKHDDRTRWRCSAYFKTKCKSTLLTYGKVVRVNRQHNHIPMMIGREISNNFKHFVEIIRM